MKLEPQQPAWTIKIGEGLTLFQYTSVAAMQGILADGHPDAIKEHRLVAESACGQAAALIAEMERRANDKPKEG